MSKAMTGYERLKRYRNKKKAERDAAKTSEATAIAAGASPAYDIKVIMGAFISSLSPGQAMFLKAWMAANTGGKPSLDMLPRLAREFIDSEIARVDSLRSEVDARKAKTERQKIRNSPVRYDACDIDNRKLDLVNMPFPNIPGNYSVNRADDVRSIMKGVRDIRQMIKTPLCSDILDEAREFGEKKRVAEIDAKIKSIADYCAQYAYISENNDAVDQYLSAWASLSSYKKPAPVETVAAPAPEAPHPATSPEPSTAVKPVAEPVAEKIDETPAAEPVIDHDRKITHEETMAIMRAHRKETEGRSPADEAAMAAIGDGL